MTMPDSQQYSYKLKLFKHELSIKLGLLEQYLYCLGKGLKGIVVNRAFPYLHEAWRVILNYFYSPFKGIVCT